MGWKMGVYGVACGNTKDKPAYNGCTFATKEEAERAGEELLMRWYVPDGTVAVEFPDEAPNYEFPADASRPRAIQAAESAPG